MRQVAAPADPPVEAVAAEIDEASAGLAVVLQRVQRALRVIFRVAAGDDDLIAGDRRDALVVEILVRDEVEFITLPMQPGDEVGVGRKMPEPRARLILEGEIARPHRHDRTEPRRQRHARPVGMIVVGGAREAVDFVGIPGIGAPGGGPLLQPALEIAARMVGIGEISEGRDQHGDRLFRRVTRRQDEEGDRVLAAVILDLDRIDPAVEPRGNGEGEAGLPLAVGEVVVVKMDRAVVLRRVTPAEFAAVPVRASHGPGRDIDQAPLALPHPFGKCLPVDRHGEIPLRQRVLLRHAKRAAGFGEPRLPATAQRRGLDLAVETCGRPACPDRGEGGLRPVSHRERRGQLQRRPPDRPHAAPLVEAGRFHNDRRGVMREADADRVPGADIEVEPGAHPVLPPVPADDQHQATAFEPERDEIVAGVVLQRRDDTQVRVETGRSHIEHQCHGALGERGQGRQGAGADRHRLRLAGMAAVDGAGNGVDPETRPGRIGIAADDPDEACVKRPVVGRADMEGDGLARAPAQRVAITDNGGQHGGSIMSGAGAYRRAPGGLSPSGRRDSVRCARRPGALPPRSGCRPRRRSPGR